MARRLKLSLRVGQPGDEDDYDDDDGGDDDDENNIGTWMDEVIICGSLLVLVNN